MKRVKGWAFFVSLVVILAVSYVAFAGVHTFVGTNEVNIPGASDIRFGIDINGGVEAIFTPRDDDLDRAIVAKGISSARLIIEKRLDAMGIFDREVSNTTDSVLVRIPWASGEENFDAQATIKDLGSTAKLQFVLGTEQPVVDADTLETDEEGYDWVTPEGKTEKYPVYVYADGYTRCYLLEESVVLEGANVTSAIAQPDSQHPGYYEVALELDAEGTKAFATATTQVNGTNNPIFIKMDRTIICAPTVSNGAITTGKAVITGNYDSKGAKSLSSLISAGALPFDLISKNHQVISPTLGQGALGIMISAGILAFILISLFMIFYYRVPGVVAVFGLALQVSGMILCISIPQFSLTLPGIAGIIMSIGMGVDANVIIGERIKEELNSGKTLNAAVEAGFDRALDSVVDGNLTNVIVAVLLMLLGSGSMWSFGYTLLAGVVFNFISGVFANRVMIKALSTLKPLRNPFLFGKRRTKNVNV